MTPDGWRPWTDADGPVPDPLTQRARTLVDDQETPLGATVSHPLPGVTTLLRLEPRVWGRNAEGALVEGCFRSAGIYLPGGASSITPPTSDNKLAKTISILTVASLAVGTIATLAKWGS